MTRRISVFGFSLHTRGSCTHQVRNLAVYVYVENMLVKVFFRARLAIFVCPGCAAV